MMLELRERSVPILVRVAKRRTKLARTLPLQYLRARGEAPMRCAGRPMRTGRVPRLMASRAGHPEPRDAPLHVHAMKQGRIAEKRAIAIGVAVPTAGVLENLRHHEKR